MTAIFNFINRYVLQYLLRFMMFICNNNFAAAIFLFTLFINLLLIPLSIKSQKASVQQTLIKPKLDELKNKYGNDKQKYNTAMQELYAKENISMSGGCLPMIIRLVFLMSVYYLVVMPLTYLTTVDSATIQSAIGQLGISSTNLRAELDVVSKVLGMNPGEATGALAEVSDAVRSINFDFFGINLTDTPHFTFNLKNAEWNWMIPILSFAAAMLSSLISMHMQKKINPDAPSMAGMMLTMPIISLVIAFSAPCGLGFYWACSSLIGGVLQAALQYFYGPYKMIAKQRAKSIIKQQELEQKVIDSTKVSE